MRADLSTAQSDMIWLLEQLAAERSARQAAEQERDAALTQSERALAQQAFERAARQADAAEWPAALERARRMRDDEIERLQEEVMVLQVDGSAYDLGYRRADDVARTRITELEQQLAALREVGQSLIDHAEQGRDEALEDRDEYKLVAKAATEYADVVLAQLAARDQQLAALRERLDALIASCATVYPDAGEPFVETDPARFDCASFCESFGHHTLLEIRALLATPAGEPQGINRPSRFDRAKRQDQPAGEAE